jgi:DNA-binding beta-propeller fold protein YncE
VILGSGSYRYEVVENWARLPEGWEFKDVGAVAVDSKDNVYVFNRGEHPMMVFDRDGRFLRSWGEGGFPRAHGLHIDNDTLYLTDDGGHFVRKCTLEGKVLLELGVPGKPAPAMSGEPFHRCTHTALSPRGDIYVSDGYGNARIHKYSPDGKRLLSWGAPGTDPGQFNIPHNIATDAEGWVYVADRENHRVQVFDGSGNYETQWTNMHRPCGLYCCAAPVAGGKPTFLIGELGSSIPITRNWPNIGPRLTFVDGEGKTLARLGGEAGPGLEAGRFVAPHGLAMDSRGDIYVGEVSYTEYPRLFPDRMPIPFGMRSLQKLRKL